jgi:hypothetical protein
VAKAELNYLRVAQILGGTITQIARPTFGMFGAPSAAAEHFRMIAPAHKRIHLTPEQRTIVFKAFEKVRKGYEPDRVLVDPVLSKTYLAECRKHGLTEPAPILNRALQNIRKNKSVYKLTFGDAKRSNGIDITGHVTAAEIGVAQLNYARRATVDDILTNPKIGDQFVGICKTIDPSGSAMQFKWAALTLRKQRSLDAEKILRLAEADADSIERRMDDVGTLSDLNLSKLPREHGIFAITEHAEQSRYLFVGNADDLSQAIKPFDKAKPFLKLAGAFWEPKPDRMSVRLAVSGRKRYLFGRMTPLNASLRLIADRHPLYNMRADDIADAA